MKYGWLVLGLLMLALAVGCASHTELGGQRMGVTAHWAEPGYAGP